MRTLALIVSISASSAPPMASFATSTGIASSRPAKLSPSAMPQGKNSARPRQE
jgi:hypothetical protein